MARTCTLLALALAMGAGVAQAAPATFSCVFQGAGNAEGAVTVDLEGRTATDTYNGADGRQYPLDQVTDTEIRWREDTDVTRSHVTFSRLTGAMQRRVIFSNGQWADWQYRCKKADRLL